jgi:mono/diheme cytochrome c family protein
MGLMERNPRAYSLTGVSSRRAVSVSWVLLLAVVMGCAGKQAAPDHIASRGEGLFNGRVKPDVDCYRCHNGDGTGTWRGPNLAKRVPGLTDQKIAQTILEGPSLMPSFKDKVDDQDIHDITTWLRERFPKPPAP